VIKLPQQLGPLTETETVRRRESGQLASHRQLLL
jgi:hypothetical protein